MRFPEVPVRAGPVQAVVAVNAVRVVVVAAMINFSAVRDRADALPKHDPVDVGVALRVGGDPAVPGLAASPGPRPALLRVEIDPGLGQPVDDPVLDRETPGKLSGGRRPRDVDRLHGALLLVASGWGVRRRAGKAVPSPSPPSLSQVRQQITTSSDIGNANIRL